MFGMAYIELFPFPAGYLLWWLGLSVEWCIAPDLKGNITKSHRRAHSSSTGIFATIQRTFFSCSRSLPLRKSNTDIKSSPLMLINQTSMLRKVWMIRRFYENSFGRRGKWAGMYCYANSTNIGMMIMIQERSYIIADDLYECTVIKCKL